MKRGEKAGSGKQGIKITYIQRYHSKASEKPYTSVNEIAILESITRRPCIWLMNRAAEETVEKSTWSNCGGCDSED